MSKDNEECPVCGCSMEEDGLDDNWRVYTCTSCSSEVLRSIANDHGEGFSMEDLDNMTSFDPSDTNT